MVKGSVNTKQIQLLDKIAIDNIGIPSTVLMENAGREVTARVLRYCAKKRNSFVCVFCGMGNNAGDGFVVARYLIDSGIRTKVFIIGDAKKLKTDAFINYRILKKLRAAINKITCINSAVIGDIARSDVIVDAIFGFGLSRLIEKPFKGIIETINQYAGCVVSIDVPSGLNATDGSIYGVCIKATETVTFSRSKSGFLKKDGKKYTGRVTVVDIGIPKKLFSRARIK